MARSCKVGDETIALEVDRFVRTAPAQPAEDAGAAVADAMQRTLATTNAPSGAATAA